MAVHAFVGATTGAASAAAGVLTQNPYIGLGAGAAFGAIDAGLTENSPKWGAVSGAISGVAGAYAAGATTLGEAFPEIAGATASGFADIVGAVAQEAAPMVGEKIEERRERPPRGQGETYETFEDLCK
jgi:hypothetical protein